MVRRFVLRRTIDVTGISGTGDVADGVLWPDGSCVIRWRGERSSVVLWKSIDDAEAINGHEGRTRVVWLDN